jgi:hypothetical protein
MEEVYRVLRTTKGYSCNNLGGTLFSGTRIFETPLDE